MDRAEYQRKSHATWEAMAAGWERRHDWMWDHTRRVGEQMIEKLDPQPGQTILELAAGTGETGFVTAARLGDDGKLISTDFSQPMIDAAKRRGEKLGLSNVEYRLMDAEQMDLPEDSVDGVLCRWGYMLMSDPKAAFAETRRVLRDGGRLAFSVWAEGERNPWAATAGAAMVAHGHVPPPSPGEPGIFSMGARERINELVEAAGFATPQIEEVEVMFEFDDVDDYWRFLMELAGGVALVVKELDERQQAEVREAIADSMDGFRSNGGYRFPGVALNAGTS